MSWRRKLPKNLKRKSKKVDFDLNNYVTHNYDYVIGIDEAGVGSISGPLVVAAVVVPWGFENPGFKDSKRYTTNNARQRGSDFAKANVLDYEVISISPDMLEKHGAGPALSNAQKVLAQQLNKKYPNSLIIVDGNKYVKGIPRKQQMCIVKGDAKVPSIAAASIIAKVERDTFMMSDECPEEWEMNKNKGYPTPEHIEKLNSWGPVQGLHRMNVEMVKKAYNKNGWYK